MKKILSIKIFWTLTFCLLTFFLSSFISNILKLSYWEPDKEDTVGIYLFQHTSEQPDIVIVGSSRARFGLLPVPMAEKLLRTTGKTLSIFNLGQNSGGMRISYAVLRDVLRGKKRPSLVLLEVKVWGLNTNSIRVNDAYFKYYASQFDILRSVDKSIFFGGFHPRAQGFLKDISNLLWLVLKNPLQARYREELSALRKNKGAELRYAGKSIAAMSEKNRERYMNLRFKLLEDLMGEFQIAGSAEKAFENSIALCRRRNIRLIILTMPLHPEDPELNYYQNEYSQFIEYVSETCTREKIQFHNLQEVGFVLGDEHFGDYDHLNVKGAEIVSRYVAETILMPEVCGWDSTIEKTSTP